MAVNAKPEGYHSLTPYLVVEGAARLIDFLEEVFDAEVKERFAAPGDLVGHAQLRIGDSTVMLSDAHDRYAPMPAMLYVYVDDVDATYQRALAAGGTQVEAPVDRFYGDRSGGVKDPHRRCAAGRTETPRHAGHGAGSPRLIGCPRRMTPSPSRASLR
jgi:PhnB protein